MDLQQNETDKNSELENFKKEYLNTNLIYNDLIEQTISESDGEKQTELVEKVLETNSELASLVREFIQNNKETNVDEIVKDLLKLQNDYMKIQQSNDHKITLDMILNENKNKISKLRWQHDILLILIGLAILVILYSVFMVSFRTTSVSLPILTATPT
jgi:hypothetical protein